MKEIELTRADRRIYMNFFLRQYAFLISNLNNPEFIAYHIFDNFRLILDDGTSDIMKKPNERGVAYLICCWSFDYYLNEYLADFQTQDKHEQFDIIYDLYEAWGDCHFWRGAPSVFGDFEYENTLDFILKLSEYIYDESKADEALNMLVDHCDEHFENTLNACHHDQELYEDIRDFYALELADRIIHDRQISAHIAGELTKLVYFNDEKVRKNFPRVKLNSFVRPIIFSRDRGKCAICGIDIASELLARAHIDHIFPLREGGCNDTINLQLTCESCNLKKAAHSWEVRSSIPRYHWPNATLKKPPRKQIR